MQGYNIIAVFSPDGARLLMCKRRKNPYRGLYNLVGGKIEPGEDGLSAAYRELWEETGIRHEDITLTHFMDFTYYREDYRLEVYTGRLYHDVEIAGDENELIWLGLLQDFFDNRLFAGNGSIGHILEMILQGEGHMLDSDNVTL